MNTTTVEQTAMPELWEYERINALRTLPPNEWSAELLADLLDQAVAYTHEKRQAQYAKDRADRVPVPKMPSQVGSVEQLIKAVAAQNEAKQVQEAQKQEAIARYTRAHNTIDTLWRVIGNYVPPLVWVRTRDGKYGVGISYTNWGGSTYTLEVAEWQDKMPSLDRTYRGT